MDKTISIVPYSEQAHRAQVIEWLIDLQEIERAFTPTRRPGADMAEAYFAEISEGVKNGRGAMFVAESEGEPVGFISCFAVQGDDVILTEEANLHGYVSDVYVAADFRGQGVFQTLESKAIDHLRGIGMKSVRINVVAKNARAYAAYVKAGYMAEEISLIKAI